MTSIAPPWTPNESIEIFVRLMIKDSKFVIIQKSDGTARPIGGNPTISETPDEAVMKFIGDYSLATYGQPNEEESYMFQFSSISHREAEVHFVYTLVYEVRYPNEKVVHLELLPQLEAGERYITVSIEKAHELIPEIFQYHDYGDMFGY